MSAAKPIAVLGGGNGGLALAADLTLAGRVVRLFELPEFIEHLGPIKESGEITLDGVDRRGNALLDLVTSDIHAALEGDVATLPYGARRTGFGEVSIFVEAVKLPAAALPAGATPWMVAALRKPFPAVEAGADVVDIALKNVNPCIHPGPCVLNTGRIEYADEFYLYREGMTPSTRRVMLAVDREHQAVREALGYGPPHYGLDPSPGVYEVFVDYFGEGSIKTAGYNMRGPLEVGDRYLSEDIPYGLVTYASLGDLAGVDTPVCDA